MPDLLDELKALAKRWRIEELTTLIARHESRGKVVAELGPFTVAHSTSGRPYLFSDEWGEVCCIEDDLVKSCDAKKSYSAQLIELPEGSDG